MALIVGAGEGNGGAIAKRFARGGYTLALNRRAAEPLAELVRVITAEGGKALAYAGDARDEADVARRVAQIEQDLGPIDALVFNLGDNRPASILAQSAADFRALWELNCYAGFLNAREVARRMVPRGRGVILFTGATGSVRGAARFAAFASAKHGLRALAQSMARELGPLGVHVAHVVLDGVVDNARSLNRMPDYYARCKAQGRLLSPGHIAESYWYLAQQPRDAWTFELDLRAATEPW
ncbi:MAG TPA: SDR family NAD(P)-dependent oxidoreductase [Nevskiaceae bacterium]|nr:SDR family NAD(P)-dependent oxidoreductase [Nevskiaceae bacterium]